MTTNREQGIGMSLRNGYESYIQVFEIYTVLMEILGSFLLQKRSITIMIVIDPRSAAQRKFFFWEASNWDISFSYPEILSLW